MLYNEELFKAVAHLLKNGPANERVTLPGAIEDLYREQNCVLAFMSTADVYYELKALLKACPYPLVPLHAHHVMHWDKRSKVNVWPIVEWLYKTLGARELEDVLIAFLQSPSPGSMSVEEELIAFAKDSFIKDDIRELMLQFGASLPIGYSDIYSVLEALEND